MANITKRGNTYRIRVSCGYDMEGKQIFRSMTWKPSEGMTEKQIDKELKRQAVLFEEDCKNGLYLGGEMKFAQFTKKWMEEYAVKQHKAKTIAGYKILLERINKELGHLRISKIQPNHLIAFYNKLSEEGTSKKESYQASSSFIEQLKKIKTSELMDLTDLSKTTVLIVKKGEHFSFDTMLKLKKLPFSDENSFILFRKSNGLSPQTISHHHRLLSSILNTAVYWQLIPYNPCSRVKPPRVTKKEAEYLEDNQVIDILKLLEEENLQFRTMITLFIYSGMRRGELLGLKWDDIDFKTGHIQISRALLYTPEKGIYEDTPKNEKSKRSITIPASVIKLLEEQKIEQNVKQAQVGNRWSDNNYVFTRWDGKPFHPDTISTQFKKFINRNDLPDVHLHSLRHTNASLLIASGTDLRTVSNRLGHAQLSTTGNIYAHAIKSADEIAANALESMLNKTV